MIELQHLEGVLDLICPLFISEVYNKKGHYDNSGTLLSLHPEVNKILFALDLSEGAVESAIKEKADTIITHHPAIYSPLKSLSSTGEEKALILAIQNNINVISMHLNLDAANGGIDDELAYGLGGKKLTQLETIRVDIDEIDCFVPGEPKFYGYGKEFSVKKTTLDEYAEHIKKTFKTEQVLVYRGNDKAVTKVASFCGGGASSAEKYEGKAELIVTSDMPHHIIKKLIERKKNIIILTHYASENYGYNAFFIKVSELLVGKADCVYFNDVRFI